MMSPEEVMSFCQSLLKDHPDVRAECGYDGAHASVILRGLNGNPRTATVRTPGSRRYSVEIEEVFDRSIVDEDADDAEVRSYLLACARLACAYIRQGATEQRGGLFRCPSLVVDVDGALVRVQKMIGRRVK